MLAVMGGEAADQQARQGAWRALAASYMERSNRQRGRNEARQLESEALARGDSESVRQLIAGYKASRRRR